MSTTETRVSPETAERPFLVRSFEAVAVEVEGRTVDVRLVPFGEVARVADPPDYVAAAAMGTAAALGRLAVWKLARKYNDGGPLHHAL